jgi:hypothetical protein
MNVVVDVANVSYQRCPRTQDLIALSYALHGLGRDDEATSLLRQSLEILTRLGRKPFGDRLRGLECSGRGREGNKEGVSLGVDLEAAPIAATLISAAEILRDEGGVTTGSLSQRWNPGTWKTLRDRLSERSLARSIERGRSMDLETAVAFALASKDRGGTGLENQ